MMNNWYYVYGLIDPRNNIVFYIGKGKKKRAWSHLKESNYGENPMKDAKIKRIKSLGLEPTVKILVENLKDEQRAYDIETQLIAFFGKMIDGTGCLTNICDDNRPPKTKHSKERREKSRKRRIEYNKSKEKREITSRRNREYDWPEDVLEKQRQYRGEKHNQVKLTEEQAIYILNSKEKGVTLAKKFEVHPNTIYHIRQGRNWSHLQKDMK